MYKVEMKVSDISEVESEEFINDIKETIIEALIDRDLEVKEINITIEE